MSVSEVERAILARVAEGLHERLGRIGADEAPRLDPAWVADAMLDAIPDAHPLTRLGPFYSTSGLVAWLGITRQALHQRVAAHRLLALPTSEGQRVYPTWQFTPDGRVQPGLAPLLRTLLAATDPWTAAIWLTTPSARLDEKSAVEWLRTGRDHAFVVTAAMEDAARWLDGAEPSSHARASDPADRTAP